MKKILSALCNELRALARSEAGEFLSVRQKACLLAGRDFASSCPVTAPDPTRSGARVYDFEASLFATPVRNGG